MTKSITVRVQELANLLQQILLSEEQLQAEHQRHYNLVKQATSEYKRVVTHFQVNNPATVGVNLPSVPVASISSIASNTESESTWTHCAAPSFTVNERVYITNHVTPIYKKATSSDRKAIVTKVSGPRYFLKTDNGRKTWRLLKNLHKLIE